jgi:hypothetical protein
MAGEKKPGSSEKTRFLVVMDVMLAEMGGEVKFYL